MAAKTGHGLNYRPFRVQGDQDMFSKSDDNAKSGAAMASNEPSRGANTGAAGPSIISPDLKVNGNLDSGGDLQVDGKVIGDIKSRSVTVGESAHIKGAIVSDTARICGSVNGQVRAASVTLARTAKVKGDIYHQTLSIEAGAELEGQVRRLEAEAAKSDAQAGGPRPIESSGAAKSAAAGGGASNGDASKPAAST